MLSPFTLRGLWRVHEPSLVTNNRAPGSIILLVIEGPTWPFNNVYVVLFVSVRSTQTKLLCVFSFAPQNRMRIAFRISGNLLQQITYLFSYALQRITDCL